MASQSDFGGAERRRPLVLNLQTLDDDPFDSRLFVVYTPPRERPSDHTAAVETDGILCDRCRDIFEYMSYYISHNASSERPTDSGDGNQEDVKRPDLYSAALLHENLESMAVSANEVGCHVCVNLARQFDLITVPECIGQALDRVPIEVCWTKEDGLNGWRLEYALTNPEMERNTNNYYTFFRMRLWPAEQAGGLFSRPGPVEQSVPSLQYVAENSNGSFASRKLALEWYENCRANRDGKHNECNQGTDGFLPKRVLDVEFALKERKLRLVSGGEIATVPGCDMRYVTLSHCWGQWGISGLPSLRSSNLKERFDKGIPWEEIPPTFLHAVFVSNWFGVKWLWIDSLCIIQDDAADWRQEASNMANIYKHALLCVKADAARDARGGLFQHRQESEVTPLEIRFPAMAETYVAVRDGWDSIAWLQEGRLAKRAWCVQERQLARRVLHFTRNELFWECCAKSPTISSETFPTGVPLGLSSTTQSREYFHHVVKYQSLLSGKETTSDAVHEVWDRLCQAYSSKDISFITDKLVALSGLAREFHVLLRNDRYVAGHWYSMLPGSLLWRTTSSKRLRPLPGASKQTTWVAPSWSWLSANHPVRFGRIDRSDALASVLDADVQAAGEDTMAALESASLTMRGFVRRLTIYPDWKPASVIYNDWHRLVTEEGHEFVHRQPGTTGGFNFNLDDDGRPSRIDALFLLLGYEGRLSSQTGEQASIELKGLLLEPTADRGRYKRVGTLEIYGGSAVAMRYKMTQSVDGEGNKEAWLKLYDAVDPGGFLLDTDDDQQKARRSKRIEALVEAMAQGNDLASRLYAGDGEYDQALFSRLETQDIVLI